jgi:hypothetical protein
MKKILEAAGIGLVIATAVGVVQPAAQQTEQPLIERLALTYLGSFKLPTNDGTKRLPAEVGSLNYGGYGLGLGPDGQSLYIGCHDWQDGVARVSIPPIGGTATVLEPCTRIPNYKAVDNSEGGGYDPGGLWWWKGRVIATVFATYDANGNAVASHFAGPSIGGLAGPYKLAASNPGHVAGTMATVPAEWQAKLGGPMLTGKCCISIISRTSFGPSVTAFDPDQVGVTNPVPSTTLMRYTSLASFADADWRGLAVGGFAVPSGFRSLLVFGREGENSCYGVGVTDPTLHNTARADGGWNCYDPVNSSKGYHAFPYGYKVWHYDLNHLAAVKAGLRAATSVQPIAEWTIPGLPVVNGAAPIRAAAYDDATRRVFTVAGAGGAVPTIHVHAIAPATPIPGTLACTVTETGATCVRTGGQPLPLGSTFTLPWPK